MYYGHRQAIGRVVTSNASGALFTHMTSVTSLQIPMRESDGASRLPLSHALRLLLILPTIGWKYYSSTRALGTG